MDHPLRTWFRMAGPTEFERYREAGFDDVVVWADQVWLVADRAGRREIIAEPGRQLGLVVDEGSNSS